MPGGTVVQIHFDFFSRLPILVQAKDKTWLFCRSGRSARPKSIPPGAHSSGPHDRAEGHPVTLPPEHLGLIWQDCAPRAGRSLVLSPVFYLVKRLGGHAGPSHLVSP